MWHVSMVCIISSYAVSLLLETMRLLRNATWMYPLSLLMTAAGLLAHTIYLASRSSQVSLPPLVASSYDWFLVLAWVMVVGYVSISLVYRKTPYGILFLPLILLLVSVSLLFQSSPQPVVRDFRVLTMVHTASLVFAFAGVLSAIVLAVMYLLQHYRLRSGNAFLKRFHLPSLEQLSRWNRGAVIIAVPLLTVGVGSGILLGLRHPEKLPHFSLFDPLIAGYLISFAIMLGLFIRLLTTPSGTGKHMAWMTIWVCGFLLLSVVGLQILSGANVSSNNWHGGS
jgi:ABC-type uncharacterized transport system permease subunit